MFEKLSTWCCIVGNSGIFSHICHGNGTHALLFTGIYEHAIDAKNRLSVPAEIRQLLRDNRTEGPRDSIYLYVTLGEGQALCLYTEQDFERRAEQLDHSELDADQLLEYERLMYSLANRVEMDKQGRIRLPEKLLNLSGLRSDVVLLGVKDHLEIHDRAGWQAHLKEILDSKSQLLRMNPRRAMRGRE